MSSLERRAWFHLGVVVSAIVVWLLMFGIWNSVEVSMAAFALLGLTGLPRLNHTPAVLNERDRAIAKSSLSLGIRCGFVLSTFLPIVPGSIGGWERTVNVAIVAQGAWLAWLVVLTVRAIATISMYHSARTPGVNACAPSSRDGTDASRTSNRVSRVRLSGTGLLRARESHIPETSTRCLSSSRSSTRLLRPLSPRRTPHRTPAHLHDPQPPPRTRGPIYHPGL